MSYSSALYENQELNLIDAQNKKYEKIEIKKLNEYPVPKIVENYINQNISIHRL